VQKLTYFSSKKFSEYFYFEKYYISLGAFTPKSLKASVKTIEVA
jgi:hypothetical protein